jgi:murein L,D-transpeptidase YcbB/YkuD
MLRLTKIRLLVCLFAVAVPSAYAQQHKTHRHKQPAHSTVEDLTLTIPQVDLRAIIQKGRLDELQWADFSDRRSDLTSVYRPSEYSPLWLRDGRPTPQALQLITILQDADSEGLSPEDYDSSRWPERVRRLQRPHTVEDEIRFDVALTVSALRYCSDLRMGRTTPEQFKFSLDQTQKDDFDLPSFVVQHLANGNDLSTELATLEPPFAGYRQLKTAVRTYEKLAEQDDRETLPVPAEFVYPGPPYPGFERLCRLLLLTGDLPPTYSIDAARKLKYDATLLQAIRSFQERHSLPVMSGFLDAATARELNVPLADRAQQIRMAMERYRWLRRYRRDGSVLVNIPGFRLYAFDEQGKLALNMSIDVGEDFDNTRTPIMSASVEYLVFRPYWDIPMGIQRDEVAPAIAEMPDLSKFNYQAVSGRGDVVANGRVSKTVLEEIQAGRLRVRQRPGVENPMGLVKFVFPNQYHVYFHDVPNRNLNFSAQQRIVSHGCIHVEKPAELAAWMLRDQPQWTLSRVKDAMLTGKDSLRVNLSRPVPVLIFYATVSAAPDGHVHFYRDIYGYDDQLQSALSRLSQQRSRGMSRTEVAEEPAN